MQRSPRLHPWQGAIRKENGGSCCVAASPPCYRPQLSGATPIRHRSRQTTEHREAAQSTSELPQVVSEPVTPSTATMTHQRHPKPSLPASSWEISNASTPAAVPRLDRGEREANLAFQLQK